MYIRFEWSAIEICVFIPGTRQTAYSIKSLQFKRKDEILYFYENRVSLSGTIRGFIQRGDDPSEFMSCQNLTFLFLFFKTS